MNETSKEYYSVDEIAQLLNKHRATIFDRIKLLELTTHKFKRDRKTYVSASDFEQIKAVLGDKPWVAGSKEDKSVA